MFLASESMASKLQRAAFVLLCLMPLLLAVTRAGADVALGLIVAAFLLHCTLASHWRWLAQGDLRMLGAVWAYLLLSSWLTPIDPVGSFLGAASWGRFILFYAAVRYWLLTEPEALKRAGLVGVATVSLVAVDAFWQYVTGVSLSGRPMMGDRLGGPLSHPNAGNFLLKTGLPSFGLAVYAFLRERANWKLWLCGMSALLAVAVVLVSGERSSALLMMMGLGVTGAALAVYRPQARGRVLLGAFAVALMLWLLAATQGVVQHRGGLLMSQVSDFRHTVYGQLYIAAAELWRGHPLTGIGLKQFGAACWPNMAALGVSYCDIHPHNIYLEWLVETGAIGLAFFVMGMACVLREWAREARFSGLAAIPAAFSLGTLAVLLFPLIVTQSAFSNWPGMLFWYSLSLAVCLPRIARDNGGRHGE